jgi:hypothetical protein
VFAKELHIAVVVGDLVREGLSVRRSGGAHGCLDLSHSVSVPVCSEAYILTYQARFALPVFSCEVR